MSGSQRGAATVLVSGVLSLLLVVGAALGVVVAMVAAHRRAQATADLAALAAARALQSGQDPCRAAGVIATANGATVTDCDAGGSTVEVVVLVLGPRWLGQRADFTGRARAGPG